MGCAASTNVNTADDVKSTLEVLNNDLTVSQKLNADSGDIEMNENVDYGDQMEDDRDIVEETTNFHNSPAISVPGRQSAVSVSNSNKASESENVDNEKSKTYTNKSNLEFQNSISRQEKNHSAISSRASSRRNKLSCNLSEVSTENKINMGLSNNKNSSSELHEGDNVKEKIYKMVSPQESLKSAISSRHSNVVYRPTASSDEEIKLPSSHLQDSKELQNELKYPNNSRSAMSESKTFENPPCEFWKKNPQNVSNANSLNNIEYEKSSRNSQFSHTYTGSIHSPFFDSLNHGNTNYEGEENQNHDEITEPFVDRVILGTGDSEKWTNIKQNYISEDNNVISHKSNAGETESSLPSETIKANLTATGDICCANLEHSNEDNTLEIENNHLHNDLIEDRRVFLENSLNNLPHSTNQMHICDTSNHNSSYKFEYLRAAEMAESSYEGMLIGLTSSPMNFITKRLQEHSPIIDQEEKSEDYLENDDEMNNLNDQTTNMFKTKSPIIIFPTYKNETIKPE